MIRKVKLGEILGVKRGTSLSGEYFDTKGDYVRLTLGNFNYPNGGFKENTSKDDIYFTGRISQRFILKKDDIITPLTEQVEGLLGETALIPEGNKYIQSGDVGLVVPKKDKLDTNFCYYLLSSPLIKKQLSAGAQQTKIRHTSPSKIEDCIAFIPDMNEQKRIGRVLYLIDNQIKANNRMIQKLQVLAQATYQRFFLQFELSNEPNQKLAPNNAFRRELPAGWTIKKIKNCIQHINTGLNPRHNFTLNNGNIKYVTVKNLTTNGSISFVGCDTISEETKKLINKRSMVSKGDILFASIAPLGRCAIVEETPKNWEINESVFSVRPIYEIVSTEYLYMFFMSKYFIKKAEHGSNGSIFNGIRISFLEEMDILVPPTATMSTFTMIVGPIYRQRNQIIYENERLDALKRKLLPLLINQQAI